MKLWIGGELDSLIYDEWRLARNSVESAINDVIEDRDYSLPVDAWDCIGVVQSENAFEERVYLSKKKRDMDFRLRIPHSDFKSASELGRERLIFSMLLRSIALLRSKVPDFDGYDLLLADLDVIASRRDWHTS